MSKILIVEDDKKLNDGIRLALKSEGFQFVQVWNAAGARVEFNRVKDFDLILLDINLPDGDGLELLVELRKRSQIPVIILTANNMEMDIVTGLEFGANDYITKPFSLMVLRARVSVQLRKIEEKEGTVYSQGKFLFDFEKMEFKKDGQSIELSKTEQRLLKVLCKNKGGTVKRSYLIDTVWQGETEFVEEHALTVAIKRLRDKLEEDGGNPQHIKTIYGIGYTWEDENC